MSLSEAERLRTSRELQENLVLSGLTTSQVAADLGYSLSRLEPTLALFAGNDPRTYGSCVTTSNKWCVTSEANHPLSRC